MRLLSLEQGMCPKNWIILSLKFHAYCHLQVYEKEQATYLNSICQGDLAGSVGRPCDSSSQGQEFKPHTGCRDGLNKQIFLKIVINKFNLLNVNEYLYAKAQCYKMGI